MKKNATTYLLLLVAIGLGVWFYLDRNKVTEGERKRRESAVFEAWRREELSRIEIAHDGETLVLERDAKSEVWKMTSPRKERADQQAVERLLTTLEFANVARKAPGEGSLGFEAPRAHGSITMGALVFHFVLGGTSPRPEGSSYFKVDAGPPFVVTADLTKTLLSPPDTYRDRTVVPYLSLELSAFAVTHAEGGFALERLDDLAFRVKGPNVMASRVALDKVWAALAEMRAETFPKDADADRLTAKPVLTITMTPKDGKPEGELVVGEACPGHPDDVVVLRKKPTRVAACAPKGVIDGLRATPEALLDKRPFALRADEIEEVRLESVGAPDAGAKPRAIEMARRGNGFHLREPADRELTPDEADAASELLTRIERSEADAIHAGGTPFTAEARARIRAGEHEETIEVGAFPADVTAPVVLRRTRDDARLTVPRAVARRLVPRETTFKPRTILGDTRHVKRVVLRCGTPQELVDEGQGLRLTTPRGYDTDGSITQLVDALLRGKADTWVADADDGSFGLGGGACTVVLAFEDGNAPATLHFGAAGEGGFYGRVDGQPSIFLASGATYALVRAIYVSRAALRTDPSTIEKVRVVRAANEGHPSAPADVLRDAAGTLYASEVRSLDTNVGKIDLTLEIALAGGKTKRVQCGPSEARSRACVTDGVRAVFAVPDGKLAPFLASPDAGARDAGGGDASFVEGGRE